MSLKRNVLANYASQIYVTLIGIVMVPLYVTYMGAEAYGLVGFFAMLQAWFQLLDMGLTPTMARETARYKGGAVSALDLRRLLRALEVIFLGIAAIGSSAMIAGAGPIASDWLKVQQLPLDEVKYSIMLMALIVALRWMCGLYRGAINGFEKLVWLSTFNIIVSTARFVLVLPFFIYVGTRPVEFFSYQLIIAVVELAVLLIHTYSLLPKISSKLREEWSWGPLRGVLKFSLSIAFTASVWVMVTQTDKLVLSKLLPLADYAYFTMAVLVASGVMIISGPISGALLPRLTRLAAQDDNKGLVDLYCRSSQMITVIAIPTSLMLSFFAEHVLWAWTGNMDIAVAASPVLRLYALGNGILALGAFPYYLQYAKGDLKLHMIGNVLFLVILIPSLVWATLNHGMIGAGYAWLGANAVYFLLWVPKVHARFFKGLHARWIAREIAPSALCSIIAAFSLQALLSWPTGRIEAAVQLAVVSLVCIGTGMLGTTRVRTTLIQQWNASLIK
ncbi:oligosaccharide flippase family protein [Massilia sp. UMI-21]|nr:oligosaccharide flippase family protein [Massilia sp. UMI-21]